MHIITGNDIPEPLREIPHPPKELYVVGTIPRGLIFLTVVGARKHSSYARDACESLIRGLAGYPICIVSGLALGIDTIAHETALAVGLPTISFPGSGLGRDVLYPRSNMRLAERIVESGGALVSEFPPDFRATEWSFPQRNRLMAGLAKATILIEAREKSGSLITARLAVDYNQELLVVPGSIFSESCKGSNQFLKLGATPITDSTDILRALGLTPREDDESHPDVSDCTDEELAILELLTDPLPRDELVRLIDRPVHETNATLSLMELKGLVKEELGEISRR